MDAQIDKLVAQTWRKFQAVNDGSKRYLIALSGIPGSGKTTAATAIVNGLNDLHHAAFQLKFPNSPDRIAGTPSNVTNPDIAIAVSLDGYHLTREQLSAMDDPEEAHFRRGAAFTFDAQKYCALVEKLKRPLEAGTRTIRAPSFDHAVKDPVEDDIQIPPTARIVVLEGLYVAMDRIWWREAADLMDEIWFVDVSIEIATERVAKRNFQAGLSPTYEAALERTEANDMQNAREILNERVKIDEMIRSVEDQTWKTRDLQEAEAAEVDDFLGDDEIAPMSRAQRMDSIIEMAAAGAGM